MILISGLSTETFSADNTGGYLLPILHWLLPSLSPGDLDRLHEAIRKAMHITEYAIFGFLSYRALHRADQRW